MRRLGAPLAILLAVVSCVGNGRAGDVPNHDDGSITLTAESPGGDLSLPRSAGASIRLSVVRVENPSKQGVAIQTSLRGDEAGGAAETAVGTVALYPPDRPGSFRIPLPPAAKERLARAGGAIRLHVALQSPVADRRLVEPLVIVVAAPTRR